jgi:dipeptidyl aminopeptidase/acylaminoacyl peptidase
MTTKKARWAHVVLLSAIVGCGDPAVEEVPFRTYTIEEFLKTTEVGGGFFDPDETRLLVSSNATGVFNAYAIELATGEMRRLTDSASDAVRPQGYMPDGARILYLADRGGNELYRLFIQDGRGGVTQLTRGEEAREVFYSFSHDETSFFTGNNERDPRFMDVFEWGVETLEPELFYRNNDGLNLTAVSRDKRWIALHRTHNDFHSDLYLVDRLGDGTPRLISLVEEGEINHFAASFTPDSRGLLYLTDRDSDWLYLMSYDLETGERREVFRPGKWDVNQVGFSHRGTYRVIGVNEDSVTRLIIERVATGEKVEILDLPPGDPSGVLFSRSEKWMRFHLINDNAPSNLFVFNLETGELRQLTDNLNAEIHPSHLVGAQLIELTARDGLDFSGYLYRPKLASPETPVPALLFIHGGPGGQSRPVYNASIQFLTNHGYAVFDLNYRGSSGFGRAFSMADDGRHGREPLWDCIDAKNWLRANVDWVDPERIGILGGSYGGYMVMAALAFEPEEFAVGVNIFGVTNWVRTLRSIPPWWESFKLALYREIGNPETQEEMLYEISPLFHADRIVRPVIVLQGANDPRVLQIESDEMVEAIRANGGVAEYVLFDDEGHGFSRTANRVTGWNAILDFLDRYLKAGEAGSL